NICKDTEGRHCLAPRPCVLGMVVDIFEAVGLTVAGRHQLDDTFRAMRGDTRRLVDLKRSTKLFMDETRAPVLDPGARKTKTGYFWALARDDLPWNSG